MTSLEIFAQIQKKKSFLCVGLDTDINKIPDFLLNSPYPQFEFNKRIIDATHDFCVAYKPNIAFYESCGTQGWQCLDKTVTYIKESYPDIFVIADAKRGDIGNTSELYARAFFENMPCDAITVLPYMGSDSVTPYLKYKDKHVIVVALSSNPGAADFQFIGQQDMPLYIQVIIKSLSWTDNPDMLMFVAGATRAEMFKEIRKAAPDNFLLVPGIGHQGGSLKDVAENGMNDKCGLIVNASRNIIYAGTDEGFAEEAGTKAKEIQQEMQTLLAEGGII